ncbi:GntR family transcriptional regulator [Prolixibacter sp. NT017]|uniref:GntR family transcriptional regulator n=1 Tax=Prolixibacter sp. NT017 TaxID=2652390 RepID=UPI00127F7AC6|nr:GntR family transcriptional regulator [Prolixibacter sp. NT017]GET27090.1 transcriptional regulator [Prolixibacter sp. NT017]
MKLKIDHNSSKPLHAQVEILLRKLIEKPEYQEGAYLPKEVDLAKKLGISRNTVRQAINKLVFEGLLIRKKGQGTTVAPKTNHTPAVDGNAIARQIQSDEEPLVTLQTNAVREDANETVARFMQIPEGTPVFKITRLEGNDDEPVVYLESYFHPRLGLHEDMDFSKPLSQILTNDLSVVLSLSREKVEARPASTITAKRLGITTIDPVLVRERYVYDTDNQPVEYTTSFYNAYKYAYNIEIQHNQVVYPDV